MKRIEFNGAFGTTLAARLDQPMGPVRAYALFAHCFTCGKDLTPAHKIVKALNNDGIAVLRFDFTGIGSSEGEFENTNFSSNVADLLAAADYMRTHLEAPSLILGHSLGGTAVLVAAGQIPEVKAVATVGAPSDATNVFKQFAGSLETIEVEGTAKVSLAGRPFTIRKQFIDDARQQAVLDAVAALKKPLLVCHGPLDDTVSVDHAGRIFMAAKHPKSFLSLDKAGHLLFDPGVADYLATTLAAWANPYLPEAPGDLIDVGYGRVAVHPTSFGKFQQHVHTGPHTFYADEPKSFGGDETGPTPYNLLLAALGTCSAMTIQLYAARKGIALKDVEIYLDHSKVHADDCSAAETGGAKIDQIERSIKLVGDLSQAERVRLIEIADKCPVHKTLHGDVVIKTREET